ncbi:PolC-type DNA polymerase III [Paenarthrobacter nicotinovorans]|uniref:3'-5' exonuclease n=1 Tax=Paenarthrobacter nicotinovorans TaxID=29320 RepID=UPI00374A6C77
MIYGRIKTAELDLSWRDAEFCVLDIETTGLDPANDRIVSYGAVPVREGRILSSEAKYSLVNPETDVCGESVRIHALTTRELADAPTIGECLEDILSLLDGRILVAHSAWMETDFLKSAARRLRRKLKISVIDTAVLARKQLDVPDLPADYDLALEYAADALGLPVHTPHHALGDAMTTAQLFIALCSQLSQSRPCTVRELTALSRR